jgi:hypothetical protein
MQKAFRSSAETLTPELLLCLCIECGSEAANLKQLNG